MAIDFPTSPTLNQIYTYGSRSWIWNGLAWDINFSTSGTSGVDLEERMQTAESEIDTLQNTVAGIEILLAAI